VIDLLADVLDLSRLEANALPLVLEPVDVRDVVVDVFGLLSSTAEHRQVRLCHDLADDVVRVDRRRLRQVLLNLVGNSIRHGNLAGRVEVSSRPGTDHASVLLTVDDDGPGIPAELHPRIFTPFPRAVSPSTPRSTAAPDDPVHEESVGLGLGLAYGLMKAMGGDLSVDGSAATGTSMLLTIPRAAVPVPPGSDPGQRT